MSQILLRNRLACCSYNGGEEQTKTSKLLKISAIVLGIITVIVGILILKNVIGLGLLNTAVVGGPLIAVGLVITLIFLRCIEAPRSLTNNNTIPLAQPIPQSDKLTFLKDAMEKKEWYLIQNELHNLTPVEEKFVFQYVVLIGEVQIVLSILAKNATHAFNTFSVSGIEYSPLILAIRYSNKNDALATAKAILAYDHDKIIVNKFHEGRTALHIAIQVFSIELVQLLINCGADVNAQDLKGNTPLHSLIGISNLIKSGEETKVFFQLLVDAGADLHLQNNQGTTVFELVQAKSWFSQIKLNISE